MKKIVLAGILVFGSSLLEVQAMNRLTRFTNKVVFGRSLMNIHEVKSICRGTSGGNGKFSSLGQSVQTEDNEELSVQSVQTEDNGELIVQSAQTVDAGELTLADLKVKEFREEFKTLMYSCVSAIYGEKAKEDPKFKLLATVLDDKHKSQMRTLAMLAQSEKNRQRDAFDREMEAKNAELEEARNEKIRVEKEKELQGQISRVFLANPSLSREIIMIRSEEINRMTDIFKKRAAIQARYSKFAPFSSLLGREDLGVTATVNDLNAVRRYVDETAIAPLTAVPPRGRPHLVNVDHGWGNRGGNTEWNNGCRGGANHDAWVNPVLVRWLKEMGEYNFTEKWGNKYAPQWPNEQLWAAIDRATSTYNNRLNAYKTQKSQYEARIRHAQAVAFPSDAFDRLVEQFNTFLSKLPVR